MKLVIQNDNGQYWNGQGFGNLYFAAQYDSIHDLPIELCYWNGFKEINYIKVVHSEEDIRICYYNMDDEEDNWVYATVREIK